MTLDSGKKLEPVITISSPPLTRQLVRLDFSTWGSSWAERWAGRDAGGVGERRRLSFDELHAQQICIVSGSNKWIMGKPYNSTQSNTTTFEKLSQSWINTSLLWAQQKAQHQNYTYSTRHMYCMCSFWENCYSRRAQEVQSTFTFYIYIYNYQTILSKATFNEPKQ